jgi:hypothetical protein
MTNSRNIGLDHGQNGKGDADRTTNNAAFRDGYWNINWGNEPVCFERRGRKLVKTWGGSKPIHLFTGILRGVK